MHRQLLVVVLSLGLLMAVVGAASATTTVDGWPHHWPNWSDVNGTFSCTVDVTQTSTGWDYTVHVDPANAYPGWGIQAFAVYASNITTQEQNFWGGYDGGEPANWTKDGGWVQDRYPGSPGTTAAFGWVTWDEPGLGNPGAFVYSGNSATFHAINLPQGFQNWDLHFAVNVWPAATTSGVSRCNDSFWAPVQQGGPPQETPEPGSLALLMLGAGAVFGVLKQRKA